TVVLGHWAFGSSLDLLLGVTWSGLFEGWGLGLVRLVTYQFAHSYDDPLHILFNMLLLYFLGTMVEQEVGRRGMFHLYLVGGLLGAIVHLALSAITGMLEVPLIGASGACYAIMVYAAFMAPRMRIIFIVFPIELRWLVLFLVGIGLFWTLREVRGEVMTGVAHGAHLGGAAYGALAFRQLRGFYLGLGYRREPLFGWFHRWRQERRRVQRQDRDRRLDQLLAKVKREGPGSLTGAERRFLERTSREMRK